MNKVYAIQHIIIAYVQIAQLLCLYCVVVWAYRPIRCILYMIVSTLSSLSHMTLLFIFADRNWQTANHCQKKSHRCAYRNIKNVSYCNILPCSFIE